MITETGWTDTKRTIDQIKNLFDARDALNNALDKAIQDLRKGHQNLVESEVELLRKYYRYKMDDEQANMIERLLRVP